MPTATQAPPDHLTAADAAAELDAIRLRLDALARRLPECRDLRGGARQWVTLYSSVQAASLSCQAAERSLA